MSLFDVSCAIPRSGRTFENFLAKLKSLGVSNADHLDTLVQVIKHGKDQKTESLEDALRVYQQAVQQAPNVGVFVDRKRYNRPYRLGFLGMDCKLGDILVRFEGDEPHNCSSLVSLGEADLALAGLDELLTVTQHSLIHPEQVRKWGMYNYHLPKEKKVRIAGSAMLTRWNSVVGRSIQDIVGFFLIARQKPSHAEQYHQATDHLKHLEQHKDKVFVKGRYADMIRSAYPNLNIESVHDVEDAVVESTTGGIGLEIVQTGSTLRRKGLVLLGGPLFLSETLYVVDYYKYLDKDQEKLREFIDQLKPVGYFEEERLYQVANWFYALEENLGDNWVNKPTVGDLFCEQHEAAMGLRPTRLQTRYWMPADNYKLKEALEAVEQASAQLESYYLAIKSGQDK